MSSRIAKGVNRIPILVVIFIQLLVADAILKCLPAVKIRTFSDD